MKFHDVDELGRTLVRLRLVEPTRLDECLARLEPSRRQPSSLLRLLESKNILTSYQVGQLEKGEVDGLVLGNYKLLYRNASGSFARVFRGCSLTDGRMIGLKVLRQRWAHDPKMVAQFHREAELCKKLRHKNIVPIYEVASQGEYHYLTMEFVEGGNLRDFISIRKKLSPAEATRYILDMAEALEYALRQGITHRDLKLTNVLMSTQGVAKLVDFGLAGDSGLSGSGSGDDVHRALEYATLEKGTNVPPGDPRSDLYFLGAIYYELLTGTPPYPRTRSRDERKQFSRYTNVRPLRQADPNVPRVVADIVERLMQINPGLRYQRPTDVIADLRRALNEVADDENSSPAGTVRRSDSEPRPTERALPTVMCIESRIKQQDILREYLSKRGFRVLVLSDVQRGLMRLETTPPDCVILMGESIGERTAETFREAARLGRRHGFITLLVLSTRQAELKNHLEQTTTARILVQPLTMRNLRQEIHLTFQRRRQETKAATGPRGVQETAVE